MTRKDTIVKYKLSEIRKQIAQGKSKSRKNAPAEEQEDAEFWKRARVIIPPGKISVHLRVDNDIFDWFKKQGAGHLTRMNAVLRSYVEAHKTS